MKNMYLAAALLAAMSGHAFAQTTSDTNTPAVATPGENTSDAPVEGENSFTEDQAKDRLAKAGYSAVSALKLDDKGIWRGTATKDGKSTPVALDYQGNTFAQ